MTPRLSCAVMVRPTQKDTATKSSFTGSSRRDRTMKSRPSQNFSAYSFPRIPIRLFTPWLPRSFRLTANSTEFILPTIGNRQKLSLRYVHLFSESRLIQNFSIDVLLSDGVQLLMVLLRRHPPRWNVSWSFLLVL